jgi:methylated-DNA-protein-cysteine methyltransferase-like protein
MPHVYDEIYKIVRSIPKGKVLTYGLISHLIGGRMSAQGVGWALKALGSAKKTQKSSTKTQKGLTTKTSKVSRKSSAKGAHDMYSVPWQRVVNSHGGTSTHKVGLPPDMQREMLEAEGIVFDDEGKLDLDKYLWKEGLVSK